MSASVAVSATVKGHGHDRIMRINHQPGRLPHSHRADREWFSTMLIRLVNAGLLRKNVIGARMKSFDANYEVDVASPCRSAIWTDTNIKAWSSRVDLDIVRGWVERNDASMSDYVDRCLLEGRWAYRAIHGWSDKGVNSICEKIARWAVLRAVEAIRYGANPDDVGKVLLKSQWMMGHYHHRLDDTEFMSLGMVDTDSGPVPVTDPNVVLPIRKREWLETMNDYLKCITWEVHDDGDCLVVRPSDVRGKAIFDSHSKPGMNAGPLPPCWIGSWARPVSRPLPDLLTTGLHSDTLRGLASRKNAVEAKYRPMAEAADRSYWTPQTRGETFPGIIIDIDKPRAWSKAMKAWREGRLPMWSYAIVNHENGHAQLTWLTESVSRRSRTDFERYRLVSDCMTRMVDGDSAFTRGRSQNPCWHGIGYGRDQHELVFPDGASRFYTVDGLSRWLDDRGLLEKPTTARSSRPATGRNFTTAEQALADGSACGIDPSVLEGVVIPEGRRWEILFRTATWLASHGRDPEDAWSMVELAEGERPFTHREFMRIVSKVKAYRRRIHARTDSRTYSQLMSNYGRRGGSRRTIRQVRSSYMNLESGYGAARARSMENRRRIYAANMVRGSKTKASVASSLGVSRPTYDRHLRAIDNDVRKLIMRKATGMMDRQLAKRILADDNGEDMAMMMDSLAQVARRNDIGSVELKSILMDVASMIASSPPGEKRTLGHDDRDEAMKTTRNDEGPA